MQRGRKLTFNAIKGMEGMPILVHDLEYDMYDQVCYVEFEVVPITKKTREYTSFPKAKVKGQKRNQADVKDLGIRRINLVNDDVTFTYDWSGKCLNGEFECYAPILEEREVIPSA